MQDEKYTLAAVAAESCALTEVPDVWVRNLRSGRLMIVPSSPDDCVCGWGCGFAWARITGEKITCVGDSLTTPLLGEAVLLSEVEDPTGVPVDPIVVAKALGLPGIPPAWRQRLDGGARLYRERSSCSHCLFVWYSTDGHLLECACRSVPKTTAGWSFGVVGGESGRI